MRLGEGTVAHGGSTVMSENANHWLRGVNLPVTCGCVEAKKADSHNVRCLLPPLSCPHLHDLLRKQGAHERLQRWKGHAGKSSESPHSVLYTKSQDQESPLLGEECKSTPSHR